MKNSKARIWFIFTLSLLSLFLSTMLPYLSSPCALLIFFFICLQAMAIVMGIDEKPPYR